MAEIGALSGGSLSSAAGIDTLIKQLTEVQRTPITRLKAEQDQLKVRAAIFDDIQTKLSALRTTYEDLRANSDVYSKRTTSGGDAAIATFTASNNATLGSYDLTINRLAQVHRITSARQSYVDQALGLSGSFTLGGAASRSVSSVTTVANTVNGFGTSGNVHEIERELGSGNYFVEVRNEGKWQFRIVDENGDPIRIANAKGDGSFTSSWQNMSHVANSTFDTGRGLTIDFGNGNYTTGLRGSGAASVHYTARGTTITVSSGDSLIAIRDAINSASYAQGNEVSASIVDNTLVLSAARSGANGYIGISELSGSILTSLGLLTSSTVDPEQLVANQGVTLFGTGSLATFTGGGLAGQSTLPAGRYTVEIGSGVNANKFRLLDDRGNAVAIAATSGGTTATTGWLDISDGSYDTGRGLTITFQGNGTYAPASGSRAASVFFDTLRTSQSPRDASLELNGISVSRARNSGLTDLVTGMTFALKGTGSTGVSVERDNKAVIDKVKTMISKVNDLLEYVKAKTESKKDETASTADKPVYTRGALAGDNTLSMMRRGLVTDLFERFADALPGAPARLTDIGIDLGDDGLTFEVANASKLENALADNPEGVAALLDHVMGRVDARVSPLLDGESAALAASRKTVNDQISRIDDRISSVETRLKAREAALRVQFESMQAQLFESQYQSQTVQLSLAATLFNRQF